MLNRRLYNRIYQNLSRKYGTKAKPLVVPDETVLDDIDKNKYKPRNHIGILKPKVASLSETLVNAVLNVTKDYPIKNLATECDKLSRHLQGKHLPLEKGELVRKTQEIRERVVSKIPYKEFTTETEKNKYKQSVLDKVNGVVQKELYNWKPVNYDEYTCFLYMFARLAPEYAVLVKIFSEIATRDPNFRPKSLFDFGSGLGSVTWAANEFWKESIYEYFNVDSSVHMNELAEILLKDGKGTKRMDLRGVYYRQFLPATNTNYDLVVSAYTLLELPSRPNRLETILNLWNKTQQYLVVVEQGTNAGFRAINEVRDFLLQADHGPQSAHVFSPCPHDEICPRFVLGDETPCNFQMAYMSLAIGASSERKTERYCYIVLKKGPRNDPQWPRVVRETLVRSKHSICRMCTKDGELKEVIFTASKHGKVMYHCARSTKWGDLLPITLKPGELDDDDGKDRGS